jgi:hypothetical protein
MKLGISLLAALAMGACGGDKSTGTKASLPGTYTMKTVNGSTLPVTYYQDASEKDEITSGNLVINSNNTFSETASFRVTLSGQTSTSSSTCTGTFTQNGNSITFTEAVSSNEDCGGSYVGSWSNGNTLTVAFDAGIQVVYRK